jgi:alpha-1,6-mannosyltransferase
VGLTAVGLTVATSILALHFGTVAEAGTELALEVAALAGFAVVFLVERKAPFLSVRLVWMAAAVALTAAVALPPQGSKDVWSYAAYGRMVSQHDANPYVQRPADYPSDPAVRRMASGWRHSRTVYGPAFTGVSAAGMAAAGGSPLRERLFFQGLAALAVVGALALLQRSQAGPGAMAWVAINPALIAVVGGGHNDVLVGTAVLAGVLAVRRDRALLAGVLLGLAVLVKVSGVLPLVAVVAWAAARRGWRPAARTAVPAAAIVVAGYLLAGGATALRPVQAAAAYRSRASLWDQPAAWVAHHLGAAPLRNHSLTAAAGFAVAVAVVVFVASRLGDADPAVIAGGAALLYLLGAAYVLPWYAGWALPVLALAWRSRVALVAMVQAGVLLVVYIDHPGVDPDVLHGMMRAIGTVVVPVGELAALLGVVGVSVWRLRAGRAAAPPALTAAG